MYPSLSQLHDTMQVVQLPMRVRFRGITIREAVLWPAPNGWTEWSPFLEYQAPEAARWLHASLVHGWDALPEPRRTTIPINGTVPAIPATEVPTLLKRFHGYRTFKVKVAEPGQTLADDIARLDALRNTLGDDIHLRVDANGKWNLSQAIAAAEAFLPYHIEYLEQPVASVPDMAALRVELDGSIKIAADENIRKASDPLAVKNAHAADVMIIKAQPLGGLIQARSVMSAVGLPAVVSSALDTAIGLYWSARLAVTLPQLPYACGLATSRLFTQDVADLPLDDGILTLPNEPPTPIHLNAVLAPPDRVAWWRKRLSAAYVQLPAQMS